MNSNAQSVIATGGHGGTNLSVHRTTSISEGKPTRLAPLIVKNPSGDAQGKDGDKKYAENKDTIKDSVTE